MTPVEQTLTDANTSEWASSVTPTASASNYVWTLVAPTIAPLLCATTMMTIAPSGATLAAGFGTNWTATSAAIVELAASDVGSVAHAQRIADAVFGESMVCDEVVEPPYEDGDRALVLITVASSRPVDEATELFDVVLARWVAETPRGVPTLMLVVV